MPVDKTRASIFYMNTSQIFKSIYRFFISIKLACFILIFLAILTGIGTIIESKYQQELANKLVYDSWWMIGILLLLAINLSMVLWDRWPWKLRHAPFVLAHIGILHIILGSLITKSFGIDASLRFSKGEVVQKIHVSNMEINIYSSYDGENFRLLYKKPVDMFFKKPSQKNPYHLPAGKELFTIDRFLPFATGRTYFKASPQGKTTAIRFHLSGSKAQVVEWMTLHFNKTTVSKSFGPATIVLSKDPLVKLTKKNSLLLFVKNSKLFYSYKGQKNKALKKGQVFKTPWMDFRFRLIEFFPQAQKQFIFEAQDRASNLTNKAIRITHRKQSAWLGQNSVIRFFQKNRVHAVAYVNMSHKLNFNIKLLDFKIKKYQGTQKAKSYESLVRIDKKTYLISMNEPLKYQGWTFYQSSFEPAKDGGDPVVSILSVNKDPGRFLKYLGSLFVVLGVILLFYFRKIKIRKIKK